MVDLREIAEAEGLNYIETTSERNGYPKNMKGAIIGFKNFQQAELLAEKYKLEIKSFKRKDGWGLWYRLGDAYKPLNNSAEDYGDDYSEIPYGTYEDEEEFFSTEVYELLEDCNFEKAEAILKAKKDLWEEVEKLKEGELVITYMGNYFETIPKESMYFYHDTNHYAIGLIFSE